MKKIGVVLSGGAIKGAFEAGALAYLNTVPADIRVVTGTSVGALNGAMLAQRRVSDLLKIWYNIRGTEDLYKNWFLGYLSGYFRGGLYNFSPLRKMIAENVDVNALITSGIRYAACTVDLDTGEKNYCENIPENQYVLQDFIFASSCIPTTTAPVRIRSRLYVDGGVGEPVPVKKAVEMGGDLDFYVIILADKLKKPDPTDRVRCLAPIAMRSLDYLFNQVFADNVTVGKLKYWNEKFVVIEPDMVRFESSFDVDPKKIRQSIDDGFGIAQRRLEGLF